MNEPIYTYVKGQGWIVMPDTVVMSCGTVVRLEMRRPNQGEWWDSGSDKFFSEIKNWKTHAETHRLDGLLRGYPTGADKFYCVFIPV